MSIASEISRIQSAKADIKAAIESKGVTVPSDTKLDSYAPLIQAIEGGGGENMIKFIEIDLTGKGTSSSNPYVIDITDKEVIYNIKNNRDDNEYFSFNIEGNLSSVSRVSESSVLCWRYNGSSMIRTYPLSGFL